MPYRDPQKYREYQAAYRARHRERLNKHKSEYFKSYKIRNEHELKLCRHLGIRIAEARKYIGAS